MFLLLVFPLPLPGPLQPLRHLLHISEPPENDVFIFLHQGVEERPGRGGGVRFLSVRLFIASSSSIRSACINTCVQVLATPLLLRLTLFLVSRLLKADSLGVHGAGGRPAIVHERPFVKRV